MFGLTLFSRDLLPKYLWCDDKETHCKYYRMDVILENIWQTLFYFITINVIIIYIYIYIYIYSVYVLVEKYDNIITYSLFGSKLYSAILMWFIIWSTFLKFYCALLKYYTEVHKNKKKMDGVEECQNDHKTSRAWNIYCLYFQNESVD